MYSSSFTNLWSARLTLGMIFTISGWALAGTGDIPTNWNNFVPVPYTLNGIPMRDGETSADPTQGSASVTPTRSDISSGYTGSNGAVTNCNPQTPGFDRCGLQPSVYWAYYDGGTTWDNVVNSPSMLDDYLFFRLRVDGDPRTNGIGLNSTHWNYLVDIDNDGFKEFWIDVDGSFAGGPNSSDVVNLYYQNNTSQAITTTDPAPAGTRVNRFTACTSTTACPTSHTQAFPVSTIFPGDTTGEYFVDVQVPLSAFDDNLGNQVVFPNSPLKFIFSTSASNSDPLQKDFIPNCPDPNSACTFGDFTPVSLSYFETQSTKNGTLFHWATSLETSNLGFDLWVYDGNAWQKVNPELIPSTKGDNLEPQEYMYFAEGIWGTHFQITDQSAQLKTSWHGPFLGDNAYGQRPEVEPIDWAPIAKANQDRLEVQELVTRRKRHKTGALSANLSITEDGIYRVTYEDLLSKGLDFSQTDTKKLALFLRNEPVPIHVEPKNGNFGPGAFFEFVGFQNPNLYSQEQVYQLRMDPTGAKRMQVERSQVQANRTTTHQYLATDIYQDNRDYSFASPTEDPWFMERLLAVGSPFEVALPFFIPDIVATQNGRIKISYWGVTNFPIAPDHHIQAYVNGTLIGTDLFDGLLIRNMDQSLPAGLLRQGTNTLKLVLPADTGAGADLIHLESFSVTYTRELRADSGQLKFESPEKQFKVSHLPDSRDLSIYRWENKAPVRIEVDKTTQTNQGFEVEFGSRSGSSKTIFLASASGRKTPKIQLTPDYPDIRSGAAQFLIISHPLFLEGLEPLIQARTAQGFQVKLVDVEAIYHHFSGGNFDPIAIRNYIRHAASHQNTEWVLLVGGDNYDYHQNLFPDAVSFIPTLYAATQSVVRYSPVDALFVDLDDDQIPDLPIGRFPVRTLDHLQFMVQKTLAYELSPFANKAVFSADQDEANISFTELSEKAIATLPPQWEITRAYIDDLGLGSARQQLLGNINQGVAFANYFGHSGPTTLSFQRLFTSNDAVNLLTNTHAPLVFAQWGCWNAYFVYPGYTTLSDKLLLTNATGAAAVIGSATLTDVTSANLLGDITTRYLSSGNHTLGSALLLGKKDLAQSRPDLKDVILGMMLLGDPTLSLATH